MVNFPPLPADRRSSALNLAAQDRSSGRTVRIRRHKTVRPEERSESGCTRAFARKNGSNLAAQDRSPRRTVRIRLHKTVRPEERSESGCTRPFAWKNGSNPSEIDYSPGRTVQIRAKSTVLLPKGLIWPKFSGFWSKWGSKMRREGVSRVK